MHWVISNGALLVLAQIYFAKTEFLLSFIVQICFFNIWLAVVFLTLKIYFVNETEDKTDLIDDDDCCTKQKRNSIITVWINHI